MNAPADTLAIDDLRELLPDWRRHLKAENKSKNTIDSYLRVAGDFIDFLIAKEMPTGASEIEKAHVEEFIIDLQERPNKRTGKPLSDAYVNKYFRTLQQLWRWLEDVEGEIDVSPMAKMKAPAVPEQPVDILTEDQLKALLDTTTGRTFENLRDRALLLFFIDTGARCDEVASLDIEDFDFDADVAHVLGKGRRGRAVPFGAATGAALRRYLRARARHPHADRTTGMWLGRKGRLTEWGIRQLFNRRADDAKVPHVYPHRFRHTFAHRWLAEGGQEQDLMRLAGWRSREMLGRYGASAADERAVAAHKKANLISRLT
ncbi:tyrosine-type recombinase/integrase [Amycolatopsis halotolerans]